MFPSLMNFRALGGPLYNVCQNKDDVDANPLKLPIYRCARPDNISIEDLQLLQSNLGIKYFLDLRSYKDEYKKETGPKLLDNSPGLSMLKVVDIEAIEKKKLTHLVYFKRENKSSSESSVYHFLLSFITINFVVQWINDWRNSLFKKMWAIFLVFLYLVFGSSRFATFIQKDIEKSGLLRLYTCIIDYSGICIRSALQLISQQGTSFVICCHAGKDRTGILSAILLSLCGHDKELIADDYHMSELGLPSSHSEIAKYGKEMKKAPRHVMMKLLDYIDEKYGSMSEYLVSIGFSLKEQDHLRKLLTEA